MSDSNPILFFSPGACSFGAIVTLEWLGKPYQLCLADRDARATDAYKRINELSQVPALKTGDSVLTENVAILHHLANTDPSKGLTFKQDTAEFDKLNMCLSWYSSNFHAAFHPYYSAQRFHPDEKVQAELKNNAIQNIRTKYAQLEKWFGGHEYHFDKPTIVDAYAYGLVRWGAKFMDIATEFPNVGKFMAAQERDPAVQFALAAEKGEVSKSPRGFKGFIKLEEVPAPKKQAA